MPCSRAGGRPTRGARLGPGAGWTRLWHGDYSRVYVCFPRTPLFRPCFERRASPEKPAWEGAPPELCCPIVLLQGRNPSSADLDHQEPSTASWPTALPVVTPAEIIIAAFKALSLSRSPTTLGPVLPAPQYAAPAHVTRADRFSHWVSGGGAQSHSCLFHGQPQIFTPCSFTGKAGRHLPQEAQACWAAPWLGAQTLVPVSSATHMLCDLERDSLPVRALFPHG